MTTLFIDSAELTVRPLSSQIGKEMLSRETASKNREVQENKANYMTDEAFADLKAAMEDAVAFEGDERRNLKITRLRAPQPTDAMPA